MDIFKLAILAFIAAGIVLAMAGTTPVQAILISGGVTLVVMTIAIIRSRRADRAAAAKKEDDDKEIGPTIK